VGLVPVAPVTVLMLEGTKRPQPEKGAPVRRPPENLNRFKQPFFVRYHNLFSSALQSRTASSQLRIQIQQKRTDAPRESMNWAGML